MSQVARFKKAHFVPKILKLVQYGCKAPCQLVYINGWQKSFPGFLALIENNIL
jgi:hypothetical protein